MHKSSLSPSTISDTKFESDPLASGRTYDSIQDDKKVLYQPPHPQHIPTSLEIAQANARIADQEVKVAELNVKMAELNVKVVEQRTKLNKLYEEMNLLTRQRDAAAQVARIDRSFIAGKCLSWKCHRAMDSCTFAVIRKVPMDILAEIFLFYLASGECCSPWTLAAVSRTFRITVFSTPRLWSRIAISNKNNCCWLWDGQGQHCNTLLRLQRALARAAAAPLDIIVDLDDDIEMDSEQEKLTTELVRTLFSTSSRWVSLNINNLSWRDFDYRFLEKDYGSLESFVAIFGTPRRLIQAIDRSAPNLTVLEAEYFQIKEFVGLSWWSRLTTLSYKDTYRDDTPTNRIQILDTILQCTLLHNLTLSMGDLHFTADEIALYKSRSLPNLRKLYFINAHCAMLFECPNLTHLSYETNILSRSSTTAAMIHNTNEFRLERLMYCEVDSPFMGQYLAPLVAPNVQDLRIAARWTSLRVDVHKSTLEKMGGLKNLKVNRVKIAKTELDIFVIDPKDRKRSILCPKLVTLDVDCSVPEDGDIKPILKEVAESRHIAGIPLESITYCDSRSKRWNCVKDDSGSPSLPIYSFHPLL